MRTKNREIENLNGTVQNLLSLRLKMPVGFQIACLAREVHQAFNELNAKRTAIISKYAKRDENDKVIINKENGMVEIDDEDVKQVDSELDELYNTYVELSAEKIKLDNIKDLDLTVGQIESLVPFIEK